MDTPLNSRTVGPSDSATVQLPAMRSGYKTTEFWLSAAAMLLSGCFAVGLIPTDGTWAKVAALAAFVLTSCGYTVGRSMVKAAALLLVCGMLFLSGCRSVTVTQTPGGGPVYIYADQSAQPNIPISALTGLDTNAWKAIANGVTTAAKIP